MVQSPTRFPNRNLSNSRRKLIYSGKTKNILAAPSPENRVLFFKDEAASKTLGEYTMAGKGALNSRISELMMLRLNEVGIGNHYIERLNMREHLIRKADPFPFTVVVHNLADDEFAERYGIEVGTRFNEPVVEFVQKSNSKPLLTEAHIMALNYADEDHLEDMEELALRVNDFLRGQFLAYDWRLFNFRVEFGQIDLSDNPYDMDVLLIDELSPQQFTLWDINKDRYFVSDNHALSTDDLASDYHEFTHKIGLLEQPVHLMEIADANAS